MDVSSIVKTAGDVVDNSNKVYNAIGALFPFFGLKHKAVTAYVNEIEKSDLSPEAKMMAIVNARKTYKELKNQSFIAKIAMESAKEGTDFTETSKVDDEWLARYMDSAKFVSKEETQLVWGRILAGEFENPGSTPPQMSRILSEITLHYAQVFNNICNLIIKMLSNKRIFNRHLLIIDHEDKFFESQFINFDSLLALENYGLIKFFSEGDLIYEISKDKYPNIRLVYGKRILNIVNYPDMEFPEGGVILTDVGRCLSNAIEKTPIDGYYEVLKSYLVSNGVVISE